MVYKEFTDYVKKNGTKIDWTPGPGKEVYYIGHCYVVLDKLAAVPEDLVVCVLAKNNTMLYISPAVVRGQKRLGKKPFPEGLSNKKILEVLLKKWKEAKSG